MANKNNFSKAVLDLMGLPGNDNGNGARSQDAETETAFDQIRKSEAAASWEAEAERESEAEAERRKFLYNTKTMAAANIAPIQEDTPTTVISRTMVIVGEINSTGDIDIYGDVKGTVKTDGDVKATGKVVGDLAGNSFTLNGCTVQGNITAQGSVTIGLNTVVVGDIIADSIKLNGKVKGNLAIAKMSEFLENALLVGDVHSQTISMNQGAKLHGNVSVALDSVQSEREFDSIFGV
ncbi:MAG TPA: polymer-forming cytoskeletal protein [Anaerovoracaceae bacterium]|nr:polymer-forming cytoskeletal protein [Anaerovoracaceae bacterium]